MLEAPGTVIAYYKTAEDFTCGKPPKGKVNLRDATIFLKKVTQKGELDVYRFTLRAAQRELKLRADSAEDSTPPAPLACDA